MVGEIASPFFIICGQQILKNWIVPSISADTSLVCNNSGYINYKLTLDNIMYFDQYTASRKKKDLPAAAI